MPHTVVNDPGVVASVETADEIKVRVVETPVLAEVGESTPIFVATPSLGLQGPQGLAGPSGFGDPLRDTKSFALNGEVKVDVDGRDYIPGFYVAERTGWNVKLIDSIHHIVSGTSVVLKVQRNGTDIVGWTNIGVTTTPARFTGPEVQLADGDYIRIVVTDAVGVPMNLTFSLVVEHEA
jgi:hypothetical protein